jgi:hypothetical protein
LLIRTQPASYNSRVALITLQTPEEQALSSDDLMRIVDNHEGIAYDRDTDTYRLTGESFGPDRRFGGLVEKVSESPMVRRVKVYVD